MYFNPQMFDSQSYGFPLHFDIIDPVSSELDKDENIQAQQDPDFIALMHKAVPDWTLPLDVQKVSDFMKESWISLIKFNY